MNDRLDGQVGFRFPEEELEIVKAEAKLSHRTVSKLIRDGVIREARRSLAEIIEEKPDDAA